MKAYQYFHLPSGYVSRVSDNDSGTLNFIEEIRKTLQNSTFFVYFVNSKGLGIALNSKVDETKNQLIRGRIFELNEMNSLPISFVQSIPDMKLMRADAPLMPRPFMAAPFTFKPINYSAELVAKVFDLYVKNEECVIYFDTIDNAQLVIKTIEKLLPINFVRKIGFSLGYAYEKINANGVDAYGNPIEAKINVNFVVGNVDPANKPTCKIVDFNTNQSSDFDLTPLGNIIKGTDLKNVNAINDLKNSFAPYINENGLNLGAIEIINFENSFIKEMNVANFRRYKEILNTINSDLMAESIQRITPSINEKFASGEIDADLVTELATFRNENPYFGDLINQNYIAYLQNNYLSLEGDALNDFALILSMDNSTYEEFFNSFMYENIPTRKAKRFEILHLALYLGANNVDYEVTRQRLREILNAIDIANSYQVITYEERIGGEEIFYGLNNDGDFQDNELDRLGLLIYSAYQRGCDEEWKKLRLKGLEVRIKKLDAISKLKVLIEIKNRIEFYNNTFYDDEKLQLVDLNSFYFDVYGDEIKTQLRTSSYRERLDFYDQYQNISYLSLITTLTNSISNIKEFLETYPSLSMDQITHYLALFSHMPRNENSLEVVEYLELLKNESDLNANFVDFRFNFALSGYEILSRINYNPLPLRPRNQDSLVEKSDFCSNICQIFSGFEGSTDLMNEINVKTRETKFDDVVKNPGQDVTFRRSDSFDTFKAGVETIYTYLNYSTNYIQPFKVNLTFEANKDLEIRDIVIVSSKRYPTDEEPGTDVYTIPVAKLKKKLFQKTSKFDFSFTCQPIEMNHLLFVVSRDPQVKVKFQIIRNKK